MKSPKSGICYPDYIKTCLTPILIMSDKGEIVGANRSAENYLLYSEEELTELNISDLDFCYAKDGYVESFNTSYSDKSSVINTIQKKKDGSLAKVVMLTTVFEHEDKQYILAHVIPSDDINAEDGSINILRQDITKNPVAALLSQEKFSDMSKLMSNISHHWRQPLNVISLLVEEMCDQMEDGNFSKDYLELSKFIIMDNIKELSGTIDMFSDFYKVDKSVGKFDLLDVVVGIYNLYKAELSAKNTQFLLECRCDIESYQHDGKKDFPICKKSGIQIRGNSNQLKQVLVNLLSNAIESTSVGKIKSMKDSPKIEMHIEVVQDNVNLYVIDNGSGIPNEHINSIFEPYFTTKAVDEPAGLGLFNSKMLIEKHFGGKISVQSSPRGTTCKITIPLKRVL